jgi:hypothetical protein
LAASHTCEDETPESRPPPHLLHTGALDTACAVREQGFADPEGVR